MRKTKWSLKLYKLQLYSTEGTLFGVPRKRWCLGDGCDYNLLSAYFF